MTASDAAPDNDNLVGKVRRLGVNSSVYFFGTILLQALQFFLVPVYTRYLTPADYGILTVANTVIALGALLFGGFLAGAISRVYFNVRSDEELRVLISTLTLVILAASAIVAALDAFALSSRVGAIFSVSYRPYMRMALWTGYLTVFITVISAIYGAAQQPVRSSLINIGNAVGTIAFSLLLVVYLRRGAAGNMLAQLIAAGGCAAVAIALLMRRGGLRFSRRVLVESLRYSLPFVPHLIANWAINLSDRFILQSRVSMSELGIYSLGCQIAAVAMVATSAINSALSPLLLQQLRDGHREHVRLLGTYGLLAMTGCCLGTALLGGEAIRLLTPVSFHGAASVEPWIVGAYMFQGVYFVWSTGTWYSMRTAAVPLCTIAAAATNIGLNLWLIPRYGIHAAAITTLIAYGVLMLAHGLLANSLFKFEWEYRRWIGMIVAALLCFLVGVWLAHGPLVVNIIIKVALLVIGFPGLLLLSGFLRHDEWQQLKSSLAALRSR